LSASARAGKLPVPPILLEALSFTRRVRRPASAVALRAMADRCGAMVLARRDSRQALVPHTV